MALKKRSDAVSASGKKLGRPRIYPDGISREDFKNIYAAVQRRRALASIVSKCGELLDSNDPEWSAFDDSVRALMADAVAMMQELAKQIPTCTKSVIDAANGKAVSE